MAELSIVKLPSGNCHWAPLMMIHHWFRKWLGGVIQQAITRANIVPDLCRHMTSLGHNKFTLNMRRLSCLVHPGVRDKRRVSEIDLSQPRHETAFWWRNNGPVTSQLTDPIKWPNYPLQLIGIFVHTSTYKKESLQQRCRRSTNTTVFDIFVHIQCIYMVWVLMDDTRYFAS